MLMWCLGVMHALFSSGSNIKVWTTCIISLILFTMGMMTFLMSKVIMPMVNVDGFFLEANMSTSNCLFFVLVGTISVVVTNWAGSYMSSTFKLPLFYFSLMTFITSMLLLTLSESLLMVFLGWEGLGVSSFLLIMLYQNWLSAKGALLTLLTNRMGDAIMMILFCYWFSNLTKKLDFMNVTYMVFLLTFIAVTKSAQWPFINWLPAAMAAPTPVSALVHSSTLVTAGVWILVRFSLSSLMLLSIWMWLGLMTLTIASVSALSEKDGKKVVALSTLSQLGMMFISLSLGNQLICLFHILSHAVAKANLFMIVGELLHKSFSQQDMRYLLVTASSKPLLMSMNISMLSLVGFLFTSGFFSKEQIILGQYSNLTSVLSWIILTVISSLTLSYCIKLIMVLNLMNSKTLSSSLMQSKLSLSSIVLLSFMTIVLGWILSQNTMLCSLLILSSQSWYWMIFLLGMITLFVSIKMDLITMMWFSMQNKSLDLLFMESHKTIKSFAILMESSLMESLLLVISLQSTSLVKMTARMIFLITCLFMMFLLL